MVARTEKIMFTIEAPGATLTYDVRRNDGSDERTLFLIGSPMEAIGFATLAGHFPDRTVVTYDPRGTGRSKKGDETSPVDPDLHADDLHRIIEAVGAEPVDVFASSGGAVNALALVGNHPGDVATLVAHEPPLAAILPDGAMALAACKAVADTYQRYGWGAGMAHFIAVTSHQGPFTREFAQRAVPAPETFGMPAGDDGTRNDPLLGQNMVSCTHYEPDFDALRRSSTKIVLAAGVESGNGLPSRAATIVADQLGVDLAIFPSDHGGFLGGEFGQTGDPDAFALRLRGVLASTEP